MEDMEERKLPGPPAERLGQFCKICGKQIPMNKRVKFCWDCKERMKRNDFVQVVRCKDCKHQYFVCKSGEVFCGHVQHESEKHDADWFCADGEKEVKA